MCLSSRYFVTDVRRITHMGGSHCVRLLVIFVVVETTIYFQSVYSKLSIIRAWFNRFAAQPRQCIFKEKILFSVSITFV
jgi:hypothetical protein